MHATTSGGDFVKFFASRMQTSVYRVIDAPSWHVANAYATRILEGVGDLVCHQTGETAMATIELRWIGSDYSAGGTDMAMRLEVREYVKGAWTEWLENKP